ncbi:MAG TPA: CHRD domain-containing protein [Rhizomicrobium sp.]|nr:CHRD domain-containing protein [Rhizomicrobium sp.]
MSTRDNVVGIGMVEATLAGDRLTISGRFSDLSSPAIGAQLRMGLALGVPGPKIGDLIVTKADAGEISGTVKLSPAAIAALKNNALYVEIDSAKAPEGNSWAWLEAQAGMS